MQRENGLTRIQTDLPIKRLTARKLLPVRWSTRIVRRCCAQVPTFGARRMLHRAGNTATGAVAAAFAERYTFEPIEAPSIEMTISPFAPPLRQISAARQGAAQWQSQARSKQEPRLPPWARSGANSDTTDTASKPALAHELAVLGWGQAPELGG